jgi:hypothetical protein
MVDVNARRTWMLAGSAESSTDDPRFAICVSAQAVPTVAPRKLGTIAYNSLFQLQPCFERVYKTGGQECWGLPWSDHSLAQYRAWAKCTVRVELPTV